MLFLCFRMMRFKQCVYVPVVLFWAEQSEGFRTVKVFGKNTTYRVEIFYKTLRLDLDSPLRTRNYLCP